MLHDLWFRLRSLTRRSAAEEQLDEELSFHRERQLQKYVKSGLAQDEALRRVRLDFGGLDQVKEECRDARGVRVMETLIQDLRYGLRMLRKSPGFTAVALLTLALGIGANTAIFSVLYGVLLRPLPYRDASRLVVFNETTPRVGMVSVSFLDFYDWRAQSRAVPDMAIVNSVGFNLTGIDQPESISGEAVSPRFLSLLGIHPIVGRDFDASEEKPGTAPVALLSYPLWQSRFGADPKVAGRTMALNGQSFTIIGVLPPDFRWLEKVDVLEPIGVWAAANSDYNERGSRGDTVVVGRLAPGFGLAQAQAEMDGIAARLAAAYPGTNDQFGVALRPLREVFVGEIRPAVLVLFGAVTLVLLIACANVTNLFLMRATGRTREMALRVAIGATRGRVIIQMLAESFILTAVGGIAGVALAVAMIRGITGLISMDMLAGAAVGLSGPALLFALGVVAVSTFAFGLTPALQVMKTDVQSKLQEGGRTASAGSGTGRWRGVLVIAEVALALVLLVGGGLMMTTLQRLLSVDAGFRSGRVLTMQMTLRTAQYSKDAAILNFWDQVLERVRRLPGVEAAALGTNIPLSGNHGRTDITVEGMALPKPGSFPHPDVHVASPAYASTLGVRLLRGRTFTEMDTEHAPPVAMINARLARQFFDGRDPIGKRFMFGRPSAKRAPEWITIVGVLGDTKLYGLAHPSRLEVYLPFRQRATDSMALLMKSAIDPAALTSAVHAAIASIDKDQPLFEVQTMKQLVLDSISTQRITFIILGSFSALALVLAAIGIYGVISYSVAQRTQEIGIRMALGARPADVLRMVIAQGAQLAGIGVLIGVVAALGLTRLMSSLLFSVSAADPVTYSAVAVALALTAVLASYIPARRTLRVDPMRTLRCE